MKPISHACPVCGYDGLQHPPRSKSGGGSLEICPSCGFQFGVDDDDRGIDPDKARAAWIAAGSKWWSRGIPVPKGWDGRAQLVSAGLDRKK